MKIKLLSALAITTLLGASAALATPVYSFGTLSGATFGGTGIPNTDVEITTDTGNGITLGLSASSKYPNPPVGPATLPNNGAGTFSAATGSGLSPAGEAVWNFDFYINQASGNLNFTYDLIISGTGITSPLAYNLNTIYAAELPASTLQDSQNLDFGWDPGFNANAVGQYNFELEAVSANGAVLDTDTIHVNVSNVPDASSTALLLGLGLGSLALVGFAKKCLRTT
jgi:hypothetical protein